jgi:hypothetical protein
MPDESGSPQVSWHLDAETVSYIWKSTRQVIGNKLWVSDMMDSFPQELQDEIDGRGGDFFDVVIDAAHGYSLGVDPSMIFAAFQREMATFGVNLEFAPHPRHGDVVARARDIEAGRPVPGPGAYILDAATVDNLWSAVESHSDYVKDRLPEDLLDDVEMASGGEAFLVLSGITDDLPKDADPSLWFSGLRKVCAGLGIEVGFADHPEHGDLLARAAALTAPNARQAEIRARIEGGEVLLIPFGPDEVPPEPDDAVLRRDPRDTVLRASDGSGVITRWSADDRAPTGLDALAADGTVRELVPTGRDGYLLSATVTPDGRYALFITGGGYAAGNRICSIDLATGTGRPVLEGHLTSRDRSYDAVQALDDRRLLVKTPEWLAVYPLTDGLVADPDAAFGIPLDQLPGPALGCAGGSVVVLSSLERYKPALSVYAVSADRVDQVAEVAGGNWSGDVFNVREVGDHVLVSREPTYELVNLAAAARRHAEWAAARPRATGAYLREVYRPVPDGINVAPEAVTAASFWSLTGPRGQIIAVRHTPNGDELVAGDDSGVSSFDPPTRLPIECDWRPDGQAILLTRTGTGAIAEADLATRLVREVHPGPVRGVACYTPRGFAALDEDALVLYRWEHGGAEQPTEAARIAVEGSASALGGVRDGHVLHLTGAGWTAWFATDGDHVYPIGAVAARTWFAWWDHAGATYAQTTGEQRHQHFELAGLAEAATAALAGAPCDRIDLGAQPRLPTCSLRDYPHTATAMFTDGHIEVA